MLSPSRTAWDRNLPFATWRRPMPDDKQKPAALPKPCNCWIPWALLIVVVTAVALNKAAHK